MKISPRAFLQRLLTYPFLIPIMPLYNLASDKKPVLDTFYFVRGLPHGSWRGKTRIASYSGLKIVFPFEEDPPFDDVWLRNVYYPYHPEREHTVIDVGAHMGFFTLKIARKVERVIAVEPDPRNFLFLALNVQINRLDKKVVLHNFALGEDNCRLFLDRSGYCGGRTRTTAEKTDSRVEATTLDEFVKKVGLDHVDLIKIDTEGSELAVLKGAREVLRKYEPDLLLAAYHFPDEFAVIANYLKRYNYTVLYYCVPLVLSRDKETYLFAYPA